MITSVDLQFMRLCLVLAEHALSVKNHELARTLLAPRPLIGNQNAHHNAHHPDWPHEFQEGFPLQR